MLFNSTVFLFLFFPVTVFVFFTLGRAKFPRSAAATLFLASLVFYGWDDPWRLVPLILVSITFNYAVGRLLTQHHRQRDLVIGVVGNLGLLAYFKYAGFLTGNLAALGLPVPVVAVALPIGISFFTFTQIAFLADAYRGEAQEYSPIHYGLFVSYFPHLVAGPILHHKEMMPQFARAQTSRFSAAGTIVGLCWFSAGLFKKVILADGIEPTATAAFHAVDQGIALGMAQAWQGAFAYSLQLYFDFSGYSDMAIGLALMFGIVFPFNFNSPYKATSLIDFWRRWHMTLSRFLRDYLYIPLGGNRKGPARRYINLLVTMVLGGLWHGAAWNFVVWGAIHGIGLLVNHAWQEFRRPLPRHLAWLVTLLTVVLAWVPFRASTLGGAAVMWQSMVGAGHIDGLGEPIGWLLIALLGAIALFLPNTIEIFTRHGRLSMADLLHERLPWRDAAVAGTAFGMSLTTILSGQQSVFLYFRF